MGTGEVNVAAATAVLGYDMFQNQPWQNASYDRILTKIACAGSAAALDFSFDLIVDGIKHGSFSNTATGAALMDAHGKNIEVGVPAGSKISAIVTEAAGTNPVNIVVE